MQVIHRLKTVVEQDGIKTLHKQRNPSNKIQWWPSDSDAFGWKMHLSSNPEYLAILRLLLWLLFLNATLCVIVSVVDRYKEYLVAKEQKIEMLKAIDDKLNECERFHKAHKVVCSIRTISDCYLSVSPLNIQQLQQ